ncbi:MAG: hypothetical protein WCD57_08805 [Acidobacteriaceae bacterium]
MSEEAVTGQTKGRNVKKRIVPFEEETPSLEPLFINCVQGLFMGDDIFLDIGVITLESMDPNINTEPVGDFAVLTRLVMSRRTAIAFREQLDFVLRREEKASADEARTIS